MFFCSKLLNIFNISVKKNLQIKKLSFNKFKFCGIFNRNYFFVSIMSWLSALLPFTTLVRVVFSLVIEQLVICLLKRQKIVLLSSYIYSYETKINRIYIFENVMKNIVSSEGGKKLQTRIKKPSAFIFGLLIDSSIFFLFITVYHTYT